jgi:hypothetical protein
VLLIWKQFVQASLFYTWPLSMLQIALMLLIASAEMVAFREIDHLFGWLTGIGLIGIVGGFIRLHNIPLRREWDYENLDGKQGDNKIELHSGLLYGALGLGILGFAAVGHFQWLNLGLNPEVVEWLVLLTLACIVAAVIVLDSRDIEKYIDDALGPEDASDLVRTRPGSIGYKSVKPQGEQRDDLSGSKRPSSRLAEAPGSVHPIINQVGEEDA